MEYLTKNSLKKEEILPFAKTWMESAHMLCKINQHRKTKTNTTCSYLSL